MSTLFKNEVKAYLPGFSIDCVIFGFEDGHIKVLLNKFHCIDQWMLPGGFVYVDEDVDQAAKRALKVRTGLADIFLNQFYLFGNCDRSDGEINKKILEVYEQKNQDWFLERFVTTAYFALVNISKVKLEKNAIEDTMWVDLKSLPQLHMDHNSIIMKAIESIRLLINLLPIGKELLHEKFTLPELRMLYEAILDKDLDRRNFQRRILALGYIDKLPEKRLGGAHKAPDLYSFNKEKYQENLKNGMNLIW
ncbi:DNA mismatch repair protein MutT [Bacteroidales bacterium]|nr:DNA mismatch repair protein MutT [Bacteroidales bacterium]